MRKIIFIGLFLFIVFIGTFLRFYQLGSIPNSLDWDEVSWGYNAYSILQTGKDEYGVSYPLSFRAFGDYKQPGYVYLDILPIKLFGLTAFAVRFPSALFGSLSIVFVYLFVYQVFRKEKYANAAAFLSMFFFAISPWSIQFSRVAFEATVGLCFVLIGTWLFFLGLEKKKIIYFIFAIIFFALSAYTYHSEKLFSPLLFLGLLICNYRYFITRVKTLVIILLIMFFSNSFWLFNSSTTARGESVLFTSQQTQILAVSTQDIIYDKAHNDALGELLHNRRLVYVSKFFENYLSHFDLNWLFIRGDLERHHAPGMGLLYLISLPFIVIGIWGIWYFKTKNKSIIFLWFFLAPLASALAIDAPNAERSLIVLPMWQIFEAFGFIFLFTKIFINRKFLLIFGCLVSFAYFANFLYYLDQYFIHTNTDYEQYWQYGYQQAVNYTSSHATSHYIFSKEFEQPYIFYLFYKKYDPATYISKGGSRRIEQKCFMIDNAVFGECNLKFQKGDILFSLSEVHDSLWEKKQIILSTVNSPSVYIYERL